MTNVRRIGLLLILVCTGISAFFGANIGSNFPGGSIDFQSIYYGTRCLIQHCDPYDVSQLERFYRAEAGDLSSQPPQHIQVVTVIVYPPTTLLAVAPLAMLPWGPAHNLWFVLMVSSFILAAVLMWWLGARDAPGVSLLLVCVLLLNCPVLFATANAAGIVVGLCVIAVWCFLRDRFATAGVLCLAVSLAIKPHDVGFVWLYFLLARGTHRRRALQTLAAAAAMALVAALWVSHAAPHWIPEMRSNFAAVSAPGGVNEPGSSSLTSRTAGMVIDLQAALSVFRDDPRIYNPLAYLIGGSLLAVWTVRTVRSTFSPERAWLALAAIVPLTMLVTYHRPYDARLLLLTVPACAMLWARCGAIGRWALTVSGAAIFFTGDVALAIFQMIFTKLHTSSSTLAGKVLALAFTRPASLALFAAALFYLWVYVRWDHGWDGVPAPAEATGSSTI